MTIFDRRLVLPGDEVDRASPYAPNQLLWTPDTGDVVLSRPWTQSGGNRVWSPFGPAWERASSGDSYSLGEMGDALANSESLTVAVLFNVGAFNTSSPYQQPLFSTAVTTSGSQSGWTFDIGGGAGSSSSKLPTFRFWDSSSSTWDALWCSSDLTANTWYLAVYTRGYDWPYETYGGWAELRIYDATTLGLVTTAFATVYNYVAPGGAANEFNLGRYADTTGYLYSRVGLAYVSTEPARDIDGLAADLLQAFRPQRPDYLLPITSHAYTGSGGLTFGGEAPTETNFALTHEYTGSGGLTLAGSASVCRHRAALAPSGGVTLAGAASTEIEEAPEPYTIGARIELQSNATYAVTATIELRPTTYAITAAIELRSTATYAITAGIALYADAAAAAAESAVAWRPYILLNGADVSSRLTGRVAIEREEDAAPLARFTWVPTPGAIDPLTYLGTTVQIWWQHLTTAGAERYKRLRFTGVVSHTRWSPDRRVLDFECTADLQTLLERMAAADIADVIPGSYWSEHVFNSERTGWEIALDRLSTTELCLWQDVDGSIRTSSIRAAAAPHYTFSDDSRFADSLRLEYGSRRDVINQITLTMDYRFPRKRHRQISFAWMPYNDFGAAGSSGSGSACEYLENPYPLCSRAMVEAAATGTEWVVQGAINYVEVWPPGLYMCGFANTAPRVWGFTEAQITTTIETPGNPIGTYTFRVAQDFSEWCIGAWWKSARRWVQFVTETYSIIVQAPQSISGVGLNATTEDYGISSQARYDDWENSLDDEGPPSGSAQLASGDYVIDGADDDPVNRAALETAQVTAIAAARGDILRAHRTTSVSFETTFHPSLTLSHTVLVDTAHLAAQGKVRRIEDTLDIDSGSATTRIELAISRRFGSDTVSDTAVAAPASAPDPADPTYTKGIHLGTHIGGRTTSPPLNADWDGYITDYQYDPTALPDWDTNPDNPEVNTYGTSFVVIPPDIDGTWLDAAVSAATATYLVDIPNDTLELSAGPFGHAGSGGLTLAGAATTLKA